MSRELRIEGPGPNVKQQLFLRAREPFVAYGGARGGGKSWVVRLKAVIMCLRYKRLKVMIVRRTYQELQENHIIPLCEMLNCNAERKKDRIALYNDSKKHITFRNGSRILFRYCEREADAERFQGTEVDLLFVDEATHQSEQSIEKINACVRGTNGKPKRTYYTCNPGGPGHNWVKRLFIDRDYREEENPEDYVFIQALVTDNVALMEADKYYINRLKNLPPKLRKAWLEGEWDIFEGQFFEDFRARPDGRLCAEAGITPEQALREHRYTHVIEPFDLCAPDKLGWNIMRSYDFGYGKPFSMAWWAVDYDGVLYRILELYGCTDTPNEGVKWTPDEQFRKAREIETTHPWLKGRKIVDSVADPAIWDSSRGESVAETAARYGIYFSPGDNARIPGWMQVHYRLQFDKWGRSRMYVFSNCKAFIRTMPLMMYSETNPEDLDTKLEDHVADEVRYMCMSRPVKPIAKVETRKIFVDPLDQFKDRR